MTPRRTITPGRDRVRQNRRVLLWSLTALPLLLIMASRSGSDDVLALIVLGGISFSLFSIAPARRSGFVGEERTLEYLSQALPGGYVVMNQIEVPNARSRTGFTEIDAVVIGPAGVFTVEVKNNAGEVFGGDEHARSWAVKKIGRRGGTYNSTMRNPIRQALSQTMTLKAYLAACGIKAWVQPVVVKANPDSVWHVGQTRGVPVVAAEDAAMQCLVMRGNGRRLAPEKVAAIQHAVYALKSPG